MIPVVENGVVGGGKHDQVSGDGIFLMPFVGFGGAVIHYLS
jgi:hypothetical protein